MYPKMPNAFASKKMNIEKNIQDEKL